MKIGPIKVELAKTPAPDNVGAEYGTAANGALPSIFGEEFIDPSKVKASDYKKMLDNDGTVQALYAMLTMPILGSNWTILPDETGQAAAKQTEFVENALRTPPHKGGMTTPFDLVLAQIMRGVLEGYAGFEKVLTINEDGLLVYRKVAWRDPTTLSFRVDDRGGFNGFKQRAYIKDTFTDVIIPVEKSFLYTYGKEFHNLKGRSAFTAAYSSYDKKRRLYYLSEQQAQTDAIMAKVVKVKDGKKAKQGDLDATVEAIDELGFKATVGLPEDFDLDVLKSGGMNLLPYIEHHNAEMARSVLAMFILLGTGSKTGSYSLSQDQSDFFIQALMAVRKTVENHITTYLLPDLYNYNFANPMYGTFKLEDLTDSTIELLKQAFIKIIEKDRLSDDMVGAITQRIADKLGIDEDILTKAASGEEEEREEDDDNQPTPPSNNSKKKSSFAAGGWRRELTPAEQKVNFSGIERKLNTLEAEFQRQAKPIYDDLVKGAMLKLDKYLEDEDYDKINEKNLFDENLRNQYQKLIKDQAMDAYIYGKNGAADELEVKAPATPNKSKSFFREQAESIVNKQFADLTFQIKQEVQKARRKDQLSKKTEFKIGDVIAKATAIFAGFFTDKMELTAAATVATAINVGRKDVYEENKTDISRYQYSAILDERTCPICEDLDGRVVDEDEYKRTEFDPPIHFRCRCIWVAILVDETDQPEITGLPDRPGGVEEPSLSRGAVLAGA